MTTPSLESAMTDAERVKGFHRTFVTGVTAVTTLDGVTGEPRQSGAIADMLWDVAALIAYLSERFTLRPGDLIFTGTPRGVAALLPGDRIEAELGPGLARLAITVAP